MPGTFKAVREFSYPRMSHWEMDAKNVHRYRDGEAGAAHENLLDLSSQVHENAKRNRSDETLSCRSRELRRFYQRGRTASCPMVIR